MQENLDNNKLKSEKIASAKKKLKNYQTKTSKTKDKDIQNNNDILISEVFNTVEMVTDLPTHEITDTTIDEEIITKPNAINDNNIISLDSVLPSIQFSKESNKNNDFNAFNEINYKSDDNQNTNISLQSYFSDTSGSTTNFNDFFTQIDSKDSFNSDKKDANPSKFSLNIFNENNSETISTISERTENDSSHGQGNGNIETEEIEEMNTSNLNIKEKLVNLSTDMNAVLEVEQKSNPKEILEVFDSLKHTLNDQNYQQQIEEYHLLLEKEKIKNEELNFKIQNQAAQIEELNIENSKLKYNKSTSNSIDIVHLQEQLENHIKTIGILVGEKSELSSALNKNQCLVKEKTDEIDELQSRLSASRHKVIELEKELNQSKTSCERLSNSQQSILIDLEKLQEEYQKCSKLYNDSVEEIQILKQKISMNGKEISELHQDIKNKNSELDLLKLRIEQLTLGDDINSSTATSQLSELTRFKENAEKQLMEYQKLIEQLKQDKEQSDKYYQNYLQHMNNSMTNLSSRIQELTSEKEILIKRDEELVQHVSELEKNLQTQLISHRNITDKVENSTNDKGNDNENQAEEIKRLTELITQFEADEKITSKELETKLHLIDELEKTVLEKNSEISQMELTIERLKTTNPDTSKLIANIESDRIAASRAVAQNVELKNQLEEMQKAFVQISNDKLEVTDKLQTEQHLAKEIKVRYDEMVEELATLNEKFNLKDEEMMRLARENTNLNKEVLLQSQELDRLRHYNANHNLNNLLQEELNKANNEIVCLKKLINKNDMDAKQETDSNLIKTKENGNVNEINVIELSEEAKEKGEELKNDIDLNENLNTTFDKTMISSPNFIASHEALEKLQQRFRKTMDEIADLTEEKQKLEHLVMQLQSETETIGEYVTLYQTQRRLLKQREIEKDMELTKLANDREQMKEKLLHLNNLIEQLVQDKCNKSSLDSLNTSQNTPIENKHSSIDVINESNVENKSNIEATASSINQHNVNSVQTATQILSLLEEIKVANNSLNDIQHCSCCSGKLETV